MRLTSRHGDLLGWCAALAYCLVAWAAFAQEVDPGVLGIAASLLASVPIAGSRRYPVAAFLSVLAVLLLSSAAAPLGWVALGPMCYALYQVATRCPTRIALLSLAASVLGATATALPRWEHTGAVIPFSLVFVTAWMIGYAVGQRRTYIDELVRHHAQLAEAERAQAAHALTEERMRIARELHDVLAHSMSVITVQAGYGYLVSDAQPVEARSALGTIETTGRQTLAEMRKLLGVLRSEESTAPGTSPEVALEPTPSLENLGDLIARTARAGVAVDLNITGEPRPLPATVDLSAYRIVQEALTNVVRHAGATTARATVDYRLDEVVVEVIDDGNGHPVHVASGTGHGLIGMQERAGLCHGSLHAGPRAHGGYRVSASLPLTGTRR